MRSIRLVLCALFLSVAFLASAQDNFGNGDGHSGPFIAPAGTSSVNIYTTLSADVAAGATDITVGDPTGFVPGDLIMVWAPESAAPPRDLINGALDLTGADTGRYELARILTITGNDSTLAGPLANRFFVVRTQIIRIPEFTSMSVPAGSTVVPGQAWDGSKGGVVAFFATGDILVAGAIMADGNGEGGAGFNYNFDAITAWGDGVGGEDVHIPLDNNGFFSFNAGGPRVCINPNTRNAICSQFGSGGNGTAGTGGGFYPGTQDPVDGYAIKHTLLDHMIFGGGGGGQILDNGRLGPGFNNRGGGAIFMRAASLHGGGVVTAKGQSGPGSGAGGDIYVLLTGPTDSCARLIAAGGKLNIFTAGGGHILLQSTSACQPNDGQSVVEFTLIPSHFKISAGADHHFVVCAGCAALVPLPGSVTDPEGQPLAYSWNDIAFSWTDNGVPLATSLNPTVANSLNPIAPLAAGTHVLQLTARDASNTLSATVTIQVDAVDNSQLSQQLITANATIASQTTTINDQASTITNLQGQLATAATTICNPNGQVTSLTLERDNLNTLNAALQPQLNTANGTIATQSTTINNLQGQVTSLTAANTSLQSQLTAANATIATQTGTINDLNGQVTSLKNQVTSLTGANTLLQSQLNAANGTIAAQTTTIQGLQTQLTAANQTITSLTLQLTSENLQIAALTAQIASLQQLLQSALNDPNFTVPGATPQQQLQNLVTAISNLNPGQKLALYKNLGGHK
jgi:peptidoglycan hydrolase CwlO-like protein